MPVYGVSGWDWFLSLERLERYLESYGSSFVDGVFVDATGFGWSVGEMVEQIGRLLISSTAAHHWQYVDEGHVPEGQQWTWQMTFDSLWEWERREGCTTDYVYECLPDWGELERHEMEELVGMGMAYVANDGECLMELGLELRGYDGVALELLDSE